VPALSAYALPLSAVAGLEERSYDPGLCMKIALSVVVFVILVLCFFSAPLSRFLGQVAAQLC